MFYQGQTVRVFQPNSNFHNKIATVTNILDLSFDNTCRGRNISIQLNDTGLQLEVNNFTSTRIEPYENHTKHNKITTD